MSKYTFPTIGKGVYGPAKLKDKMVKQVGFEPTKPEGNGVTARPNTPTLALLHETLDYSTRT